MRHLSIGFVVPFGDPSEGFFPDALLALLCERARAAGHRAELVRAYYDGRDPEADRRVAQRLEGWLGERDVDLVVCERLFDAAPVLAHLARKADRTAVLVSRGDSFDPVEGVSFVVGGHPGVTRTRATRRTPAIAELELAFQRLVERLAAGGDPSDVPGVARVVDGELLLAAPLERPSGRRPFVATVEQSVICEGPAPLVTRKTLFGNVGCPYAADPLENKHFSGVTLPLAAPVARLGCAFCALGGDYEKRPDGEVVGDLIEQATFWATRLPTVREFVLNDQHSLRYLGSLVAQAGRAGLRRMTWLFAARADAFVREQGQVRAAIAAAQAAGQRLELYLTGFEAFSDVELSRYNKGVTVEEELAAVRVMRELAAAHPEAFGYAGARGHSLIPWNPWTRPEELAESIANVRAAGLSELFHELGRNRLRLYRDLPLYYAALRDGALREAWEDGDEGAGRRKGYSVEHPWRFLDRRTRVAYGLAGALRELLGLETEVAQLAAVAAFATGLAQDVDATATVARVVDDARAFAKTLARFGRERRASDPRFGEGRRAAVVAFAGGCNNGCPGCANRDRWLDDTTPALDGRVDAARAAGDPVVFAGREPTLHPAFMALLSRARGADGRSVGLVTNGRRFSYAPFARAAVQAGLTTASVKLFGPDAASADAYSRDAGAFDQAVAGTRQLRRAGVRDLEWRVVLHRGLVNEVARFEKLIESAGVSQLRVEAPVDAVGLDSLRAAGEAVERLAAICTRAGAAFDATPLETGMRLFDWIPGPA